MAVIEALMKRKGLVLAARGDEPQVTRVRYEYPVAKRGQSPLSEALACAYSPSGAYAESLRTLRSQLLMRWLGKHDSTVAVVCARTGAGCSTLAANLAIVFAQLGERTLLVDANLRTPVQHQLFGLGACAGLSDVLNEGLRVEEALRPAADFDCLQVLSAGKRPPNPQETLGRPTFAHLLRDLRNRFEVIILDTPPLLEFADAQIAAARARACVIGARRHRTSAADLARVRMLLSADVTTTLGAVIND